MADAGLVVETTHGNIRSKQRGEVAIWKAIPFAAPPVGEWRFRPPQPAQPWTGERDGTRFGAASA